MRVQLVLGGIAAFVGVAHAQYGNATTTAFNGTFGVGPQFNHTHSYGNHSTVANLTTTALNSTVGLTSVAPSTVVTTVSSTLSRTIVQVVGDVKSTAMAPSTMPTACSISYVTVYLPLTSSAAPTSTSSICGENDAFYFSVDNGTTSWKDNCSPTRTDYESTAVQLTTISFTLSMSSSLELSTSTLVETHFQTTSTTITETRTSEEDSTQFEHATKTNQKTFTRTSLSIHESDLSTSKTTIYPSDMPTNSDEETIIISTTRSHTITQTRTSSAIQPDCTDVDCEEPQAPNWNVTASATPTAIISSTSMSGYYSFSFISSIHDSTSTVTTTPTILPMSTLITSVRSTDRSEFPSLAPSGTEGISGPATLPGTGVPFVVPATSEAAAISSSAEPIISTTGIETSIDEPYPTYGPGNATSSSTTVGTSIDELFPTYGPGNATSSATTVDADPTTNTGNETSSSTVISSPTMTTPANETSSSTTVDTLPTTSLSTGVILLPTYGFGNVTSSLATSSSSNLVEPTSVLEPSLTATAIPSLTETSDVPNPTAPYGNLPNSTLCGESGNFTLNWDDEPLFVPSDNNTVLWPPVLNPYHHFFFANGYAYAKPTAQPFSPASSPNLAIFLPNLTDTSPRNDGCAHIGEIGAGPRGSDSIWWFDAFSAEMACDNSSGEPCTMIISGYKYNAEAGVELKAYEQTAKLPPCNSGLFDCKLNHIGLEAGFRGLSGIQFEAFVGSQERRIFMMDNLNMGWANNSCDAGLLRSIQKK